MSSVASLPRRQNLRMEASWTVGEAQVQDDIVEEIQTENIFDAKYPISVDGGSLDINSSFLDIARVYPFDYLDSKMVLWKQPDGAIDLYEIVEE